MTITLFGIRACDTMKKARVWLDGQGVDYAFHDYKVAGANKADAIREFLGEAPFRGRRPIFIGDDLTDEKALEEVQRVGGLSVAVGDRVRAMLQVSSPRDVRVFLEELADAVHALK